MLEKIFPSNCSTHRMLCLIRKSCSGQYFMRSYKHLNSGFFMTNWNKETKCFLFVGGLKIPMNDPMKNWTLSSEDCFAVFIGLPTWWILKIVFSIFACLPMLKVILLIGFGNSFQLLSNANCIHVKSSWKNVQWKNIYLYQFVFW